MNTQHHKNNSSYQVHRLGCSSILPLMLICDALIHAVICWSMPLDMRKQVQNIEGKRRWEKILSMSLILKCNLGKDGNPSPFCWRSRNPAALLDRCERAQGPVSQAYSCSSPVQYVLFFHGSGKWKGRKWLFNFVRYLGANTLKTVGAPSISSCWG